MSAPRIEPSAAKLFTKKRKKVAITLQEDASKEVAIDKTVQSSDNVSVPVVPAVPPADVQPTSAPLPRRRG